MIPWVFLNLIEKYSDMVLSFHHLVKLSISMMIPITVMAISQIIRMIPRTLKIGLTYLFEGFVQYRIPLQKNGIAGMM
jgi:hypothetical protein